MDGEKADIASLVIRNWWDTTGDQKGVEHFLIDVQDPQRVACR